MLSALGRAATCTGRLSAARRPRRIIIICLTVAGVQSREFVDIMSNFLFSRRTGGKHLLISHKLSVAVAREPFLSARPADQRDESEKVSPGGSSAPNFIGDPQRRSVSPGAAHSALPPAAERSLAAISPIFALAARLGCKNYAERRRARTSGERKQR